MQLLIDIGNSRLKWAWSDKTLWETGATTIGSDPVPKLVEKIGEPYGAPEKIGIVSVASEALFEELDQLIKDKWDAEIVVVESVREQAGVRNAYADTRQLGDDRWSALIAARAETQSPVCVVSCGTATTVDAMNARGEFIGGAIFPGLELLRDSLRSGTEAIASTDGRDDSCRAITTDDAVMGGTRFGLAGAINKIVAEHRRVLGADSENIITGGNAETLMPLLDFSVNYVPDLVLLGVKRIVETQS